MAKKIVLSGVKPTGAPHLGNYFGAMRQFVDLQADHDLLIMVADYHALTTIHNPKQLATNIVGIVLDYLAIGLDPERVIIFKQSDVPEHTELGWIFNCLTTTAYLQRAHAYKDAMAKNAEVGVGTFTYPMLMAADILLYETDIVPVGQDQKQHLEITRDTAEKFNRVFGETFKLPEPLILGEVAVVPGLDGQKMSKSYGNTIPLFASDEEIKALVMKIKTDSRGEAESKDPNTCNIFALHRLISQSELAELEQRYLAGSISYKESKEILAENIIKLVAPMRERREAWAKDENKLLGLLASGGQKARERARLKLMEVRRKIGVDF